MEDLIGFLIFLFIVYRTIDDRKKGKQKSLSSRKKNEGRGQQVESAPLQDDPALFSEEQKPEVDWGNLEELAKKMLGVDNFTPEDEAESNGEEKQIEERQKEQNFSPELLREPEAVAEEIVSVAEIAADDLVRPVSISVAKPEVVCSKGSSFTGVDLKQAVIWSEILQKPKALRRR